MQQDILLLLVSILCAITLALVGWIIKTLAASKDRLFNVSSRQKHLLDLVEKHLEGEEKYQAVSEALQKDLHRWHAPDDKGRQTWKDTGPLLEKMEECIDMMKELLQRLPR